MPLSAAITYFCCSLSLFLYVTHLVCFSWFHFLFLYSALLFTSFLCVVFSFCYSLCSKWSSRILPPMRSRFRPWYLQSCRRTNDRRLCAGKRSRHYVLRLLLHALRFEVVPALSYTKRGESCLGTNATDCQQVRQSGQLKRSCSFFLKRWPIELQWTSHDRWRAENGSTPGRATARATARATRRTLIKRIIHLLIWIKSLIV